MSVLTAPTKTMHLDAGYLRIKRTFDVVFTLFVAPFLLLVCAIIAVSIKLESKGPIIFRQKRIGQHGAEFELFKFRSMYQDSDDGAHREAIAKYMRGERLNDAAKDTCYKQGNDPRITRVGRFIRQTSLDELPQFLNVIHGQMTLVGPRPPMPYETEFYSANDVCLENRD
jgi:lipopolysaccharide/colanic/teichoic acid biosynthesis glycosyltransferase